MNYFKENRLIYWLVAILVILNISTLAMLWMQNDRGHKRGMDRMEKRSGERKGRMAKALKLTEAQVSQFETLRQAHREKVNEIRRRIGDEKKQKLEMLTTSPIDSTSLVMLDQSIGSLHTEMERSLNEHYYSLQAICNDEQKELLKKRFRKIFDRPPHSKRRGRKH